MPLALEEWLKEREKAKAASGQVADPARPVPLEQWIKDREKAKAAQPLPLEQWLKEREAKPAASAKPGAAAAPTAPTLRDVPQREPNATELEHFRLHPENAGMATDDGAVILNPFSTLKPEQREAVLLNEQARVHMLRSGKRPAFALTPEQRERFRGYSADEQDIRETIAARIVSGDPSAGNVTQSSPEIRPAGRPAGGNTGPCCCGLGRSGASSSALV